MHDSEYLREYATSRGNLSRGLFFGLLGVFFICVGLLDKSIPELPATVLILCGMVNVAYSLNCFLKSFQFYRTERRIYGKRK